MNDTRHIDIAHPEHDPVLERLFADAFRRHERRLYALALKMTKSDPAARDIIQDVFLKLWEQRQHLREIANMEAWLYRLTEHRVIDFLRKTAADDRLREALWQQIAPNGEETATLVHAREYHQIVRKAIDRLPPQRQLIYRLNREEGLNYQEIASELRISRHTVKNQLSTALQSIRSFILKTAGPLLVLSVTFF
ncbi:RNA polymerase sigma factor [Chitinophaga lutea]